MRALAAALGLIVLALLAGCGSDEAAPTTTVSIPAEAATTTEEASTTPVPADDSAGDPEAADDPGADRPRSVEDVVVAVLTGSETPEVICDQLVTPEYVTTAYGDRAGCLAAQKPGALADSVHDVTADESGGSTATAVAVPVGGPYDGVEVEVQLVASSDLEGAWLVESLVADVPAGP